MSITTKLCGDPYVLKDFSKNRADQKVSDDVGYGLDLHEDFLPKLNRTYGFDSLT